MKREIQAQKRNILGRRSLKFLVIARGDSLVDTVNKLLRKPDADWVLVEWQEANHKYYSVFSFRFFVERFVTPNLASSDDPGMDSGEGEERYQHLLDRTLAKATTTPPMADKMRFMRFSEKEVQTAIGRAASQHAMTHGVQSGKVEWDAENLATALRATLARVVIRNKSEGPTAVWHPVKPTFPINVKRLLSFNILIPNIQKTAADETGSDRDTELQEPDSALSLASDAGDTQTLATLSRVGTSRSTRLIFNQKAAQSIAQSNAKITPGQMKTSVSSEGNLSLLVPMDVVDPRAASVSERGGPARGGGGSPWSALPGKLSLPQPPKPHPPPPTPAVGPEPPAAVPQGSPENDEHKFKAQQLFPEISCNPSHVIQNKKFTVVVRVLREKPPTEQTKGDFWLPPAPPEQVHIVNVHLLMRDQSKQGEMTCSAAAGTIKQAVFELNAPEIETDEKERVLELIRVNFYVRGRWCGEAQTNIEILRDEKVRPRDDRNLAPEEPMWRRHLHVEPGAPPPDFLIRIQSSGDNFRWTFLSPHLNFKLKDEDCIQKLAKPERYVADNFEWLAGKKSDGINRDNVEGSCQRLYAATPQAFKDAYWQLFHAVNAPAEVPAVSAEKAIKFETIQFVSDEPSVPWEIMQVVDRDIEPDVGPVILSEKYKVGRWLAKSSCILRSQINVREFRVSTSTYSQVKDVTPLPWTQDERNYLSANPWNAQILNLLVEDIRKFLVEGTAQAIHFACHGEMDQAQPQRSKIWLEDDRINFLTTAVDRDSVRLGIGSHHPLVFLNACQLGAGGMVLNMGSGWPQAFLDVGASAFIGPLWSVQDESARDAATHFYEELRVGKSMGEALQTMRKKWLDGGSVTFLAYTLYGDPTAKVVRIPATSDK
jgi:hypothetical protein